MPIGMKVCALLLISSLMLFSGQEESKAPSELAVSSQTIKDNELKDFLCEYAIKELMERCHHEERSRISQERQKWAAIIIGGITTLVPLVITIVQATAKCDNS